MLVVEVETGVSDCDAAVGAGQRGQTVPRAGELGRVVRVQAHGRVHVVVARREVEGLLRSLEAGSYAHHPLDAAFARTVYLRVGVVGREPRFTDLELQMTMRVDPHL